ncbi:MAG: SDR family NAD(P)-dependent oxidoreductase [bacterium]|nr:SDR family NAD(P)-dependent oxidoreductase [bacterium]
MRLKDKITLITGGAHGIGRALAERFHAEGATAVAVADLDEPGARDVAASIGGLALEVDVSKEEDIRRAVERTETELGPIDLLCSNAGVAFSEVRTYFERKAADYDRWLAGMRRLRAKFFANEVMSFEDP